MQDLKENKSLVSVEKPEKVCEFDLNLVMTQMTLYIYMNPNWIKLPFWFIYSVFKVFPHACIHNTVWQKSVLSYFMAKKSHISGKRNYF